MYCVGSYGSGGGGCRWLLSYLPLFLLLLCWMDVGVVGLDPCTTTDGSVANSNSCTCGTNDCTTTTGLFCDTAAVKGTGQCSLSSDS